MALLGKSDQHRPDNVLAQGRALSLDPSGVYDHLLHSFEHDLSIHYHVHRECADGYPRRHATV